MTEHITSRDRVVVKFYLDAGSLETKSLRPVSDVPTLIVANQRLRDVLQEKAFFVHYHEFNGGHAFISWRGSFSDAIISLFGNSTS